MYFPRIRKGSKISPTERGMPKEEDLLDVEKHLISNAEVKLSPRLLSPVRTIIFTYKVKDKYINLYSKVANIVNTMKNIIFLFDFIVRFSRIASKNTNNKK